jgi:hypothetical protein
MRTSALSSANKIRCFFVTSYAFQREIKSQDVEIHNQHQDGWRFRQAFRAGFADSGTSVEIENAGVSW